MALGLTQPLTEMSTRNFPGGKKWLLCRADNLAAECVKMCDPQPLATLRASIACTGIALPFTYFQEIKVRNCNHVTQTQNIHIK
jgi:hypothetical protein